MPVSPFPLEKKTTEEIVVSNPGSKRAPLNAPASVAALLLLLLFCSLTFIVPPCSRCDSYWGSSADKHARLEAIQSPKLVLVGGSNLAFGIDSPLIEKTLQMPVVNMGLSANLGLRFMLEEIKDSLKAGDIVVISPEHQLFFGLKDGCKDIFRVVQANPAASRWLLSAYILRPENAYALFQNFKQYLSAKWNWWYSHLIDGKPDELFCLNEASKRDYNACGDYLYHKGRAALPFADQEILSPFDPAAITLLNDFYTSTTGHGVQVFLAPPSTAKSSFCSTGAAVDGLYSSFKEQLKVPVIAARKRYIFSRGDCFDGPYHLLFGARQVRTQRLVEDLQKQLGAGNTTKRL